MVISKACTKCGLVKPTSEFSPRGSGFTSHCKSCKRETASAKIRADPDAHRAKQAVYRDANREHIKTYSAKYRAENIEKALGYESAYRLRNPEAVARSAAKHKADNPKAMALYSKAYKARHRDKVLAARLVYRVANKDRCNALTRAWNRLNQDRRLAAKAKRRAREKVAIPAWSNLRLVSDFYKTAKGLEMLLGEFYHVDHIVPLNSEIVCGLHCEANLQVIPAIENLSKGNRFWPDMP